MSFLNSFSEGLFFMTESLTPKRPNYGTFTQDKIKLSGDLKKINRDLSNVLAKKGYVIVKSERCKSQN